MSCPVAERSRANRRHRLRRSQIGGTVRAMTDSHSGREVIEELAFLRELLVDFYSTQIDAGAVLREEVERHILDCGRRAELRTDNRTSAIRDAARAMIEQLPEGWATGDDGTGAPWHDPA